MFQHRRQKHKLLNIILYWSYQLVSGGFRIQGLECYMCIGIDSDPCVLGEEDQRVNCRPDEECTVWRRHSISDDPGNFHCCPFCALIFSDWPTCCRQGARRSLERLQVNRWGIAAAGRPQRDYLQRVVFHQPVQRWLEQGSQWIWYYLDLSTR